MSCFCSSCCEELLNGIRKEQEKEVGRRKMDVSLLREEYRSSRERRRRCSQVLLLRTVSEELSEAVSIIPIAQGLMSPWESNSRSPPAVTFNPDWMICDPWHVHLDLHRRSCPRIIAQLPVFSPETSSRRSCSSSTEAGGFQHESRCRKLSSSLSSFTETSPCCTFSTTREEEDPDPTSFRGSEVDQAQHSPDSSLCTVSEESSTPIIASMVSTPSTSTTNLHQDQDQTAEKKTSNSILEESSSRKFSAPAFRFTRQLSVGGATASSSQIYYPFPSRKTQRISEAARWLGMYSSS